ncbi:L,D-transpeptidase family protein [Pedobacter frigoris]|uniref:L,D-transpeptidase n=1 Tax=Pedobacter frigoris TaxID=2571272 RepID=A0A4U1CV30_9SPHI|nr:L,D-transpeptidase family protein [Pedobacter frigoris]TKC09668.1 L,D-transpeptidase [Pedobacter frigoris]
MARIFTLGFGIIILVYVISSFKKEPSVGELLAESFENEIYDEFDTLAFDSVFTKTLDSLSTKLSDFQSIKTFYTKNGYCPTLVIRFYKSKNLDVLLNFLQNSTVHGFDPERFSTTEFRSLLGYFKGNNEFNNVSQSYSALAKLELLSANAYIKYINYLKFGVVNPQKVFSRYFINVKRPDVQSTIRLLNSGSMSDTLVSVQGKSLQYMALQSAFIKAENDSVRRTLAVNMERLRWILPQTGEDYVQVNIPDFTLIYFKQRDTLTTMKVCVGSKADDDYEKKMDVFKKTGDYDDKPNNHETPILFSSITLLYVNPVWNIPESIVKKEIYPMARRNSSYLRRNDINVYHKNKLVNNPAGIRWSRYDVEKLPFLFVQRPGIKNSLGKFKFAFENNSSIFLHDTNNKKAFKQSNRAISHGCIRLEQPLKFAELLVGDKDKCDKLRSDIGLVPINKNNLAGYHMKRSHKLTSKDSQLTPSVYTPKKSVPLLITYFTAWEMNNKIEYRPDVYGLDKDLWAAMNKINR